MKLSHFQKIYDYPIEEFKSHIVDPENDRIIFSGKFGMGKTRFLENVFLSGNQTAIFGSEKYDVYRIFPVNYSISSTEDVIRYIKYDLILEMLQRGITMDETKLDFIRTLPLFLQKNLHKIAGTLVSMVPKVGKDIAAAFDRIEALRNEFLTFQKGINLSPGDAAVGFLEELEDKVGGLYESDY